MKNLFCEVNLSDGQEFIEHSELLDYDQQRWMREAFSPYKLDNEAYSELYFENARFLIYARGGNTQKYCRCGMSNMFSRLGPCGYRKFCSRCATWEGMQRVERFRSLYPHGNWYSLTLSLTDAVQFNQNNIC